MKAFDTERTSLSENIFYYTNSRRFFIHWCFMVWGEYPDKDGVCGYCGRYACRFNH